MVAVRDKSIAVSLVERVLGKVPRLVHLSAAALLPLGSPEHLVAAARALIDLEQAVKRRRFPVPIGQRAGGERVWHYHNLLAGLAQGVVLHPLPHHRGCVVRRLEALFAIDRPQGAAALEVEDVAVASGSGHRVLIGVDPPELRGMGVEVDHLLRVPPLVVPQGIRPTPAQDFVVIAWTDEVHLRRVYRVAVGVLDRAVARAMAAHVGMPVAIAEQERVGLAAGRHGLPLARFEAGAGLRHHNFCEFRLDRFNRL